MADQMTADRALVELTKLLVNVSAKRTAVKGILVRLSQDAYRRGFNMATKVDVDSNPRSEKRLDHE